MEYQRIKFFVADGIARIILNNPDKLNPLDVPTYTELVDVMEECRRNDIKVVVISGEGKGFCAGGDLLDMTSGGWDVFPKVVEDQINLAGELALRIRKLDKPIIASLKGAVAGAGFNLALLCDFRIAADNCKFTQAFIKIGLIPDLGGTFILSRIVGIAKATELAMTGDLINAQEAMSMGLLTKVVPLQELEAETVKLAEKLARSPQQAIGMIKSLITDYEFEEFEKYLQKEAAYQIQLSKMYDAREGVSAFLEKRRPEFQ
mgnify:CR=1 FL=1